MTFDPHAPIRRAVRGWQQATAPPVAPGTVPVPPPAFFASLPAVGRYDPSIGKLVATYPPVAYARELEALAVTCSQVVPVHLYAGSISPATRISSYGDGSLADYSPPIPRYIPENAAFLVVWDVTLSTATGNANAQIRQLSNG